MKYQELVDVYSALENTTKRLEKTQIISNFLLKLDSTTLEQVGLLILGSIFPAWSDKEIGIGNKLVMQAVGEAVGVTPDKVEDAVRDQGDIGLACISLYAKKSQTTFFSQPLTIDFVFKSLRKLSEKSGARSTKRKIDIILEMLSQASASEAKYLTRTILEELRIGVGEGVVRDAIAQAFNIDKSVVERAMMLTNDLGLIAVVAKEKGEGGLKELNLTPGTPVKPMLAQLAPPIPEIINEMGVAICETKYDGIRLQVHRHSDEIKIFTRRLENITHALPEIVDLFIAGGGLPGRQGKCHRHPPVTLQNPRERGIPYNRLCERSRLCPISTAFAAARLCASPGRTSFSWGKPAGFSATCPT